MKEEKMKRKLNLIDALKSVVKTKKEGENNF